MTSLPRSFIFTLLVFVLFNPARAQDLTITVKKAQAFSTAFTSGQYQTAATFFAPNLGAQINADKLEEVWNQLLSQLKALESKGEITAIIEDNVSVTYQPYQFESSLLDLKLAFDDELKIIGMVFVPHKVFELELTNTSDFYEEEILVGEGTDFQLRGIVTLPKNKSKVPAIILVHGSGPNDMDETYGPNKLFRDLAHGLATQGVAVIRYDKRTKTYGGSPKLAINSLTLYEETIEDALAAVNLASKHKQIDKKNIFVLGHSLGGMSAPRIGQFAKRAKGIIILAGNARPLQTLVLEQYQYLFSEDDLINDEEQNLIDDYKKQLESLEALKKNEASVSNLPFGLPPAYWQYLLDYDQVKTAQELDKPILILQGIRDYQVPMTDYEVWKQALAHKTDVDFKAYEKLNHQMREGEGASYPNEYQLKSPLPDYLVNDIANWIFKNK